MYKASIWAYTLKKKPKQYNVKIVTKRNDARLDNHQRLQMQGWRADCDIQLVIDYHACVEYTLPNIHQKVGHVPLSWNLHSIPLSVTVTLKAIPQNWLKGSNEVTWAKGLFCTRNNALFTVTEIGQLIQWNTH